MSAPTPPLAPPGWHWQPSIGRWLWWDGYRWIDPATTQYGAYQQPEPQDTWWPERFGALRFPAAIVGIVFMVVTIGLQLWLVTMTDGDADASGADGTGVLVLYLIVMGLSVLGMPAVALLSAKKWGSQGVLRSLGLRFRWIDLAYGFGTFIGSLITFFVLSVIYVLVGLEQGSNLQTSGGRGSVSVFEFVFLLVLAGVIAPITEELLFRGSILRGLHDKLSIWPAIVIQGVVFGCMHFTPDQGVGNVTMLLSLSVLGVYFGIATRATGRLGAAIMAHALFNSFQVVLFFLGA